MSEVLTRMARTIGEFQRSFALAGRDGKVVEAPGVVASVCPAIGSRSLFNAAAHVDSGALAAALPRLRDEWDGAGVTAWGVWAHESDDATAALLGDTGLRIDSSPTAMAAPVAAIAPPEGNVTVDAPADLAEIDAVVADAYELPQGVMAYAFPGLLERFRCHVARDAAGNAVAAVATVVGDGDLGITMVGTREAARGRGFASEAMRCAVAEAAELGCTTTSLQSSRMGRNVYLRLGYEEFGVYNLWEHRTPAPPADAGGAS